MDEELELLWDPLVGAYVEEVHPVVEEEWDWEEEEDGDEVVEEVDWWLGPDKKVQPIVEEEWEWEEEDEKMEVEEVGGGKGGSSGVECGVCVWEWVGGGMGVECGVCVWEWSGGGLGGGAGGIF